MSRHTLVLHLMVTYEIEDPAKADIRDLEDNLMALASHASRNGWLTEGTDATVVVAAPSVETQG